MSQSFGYEHGWRRFPGVINPNWRANSYTSVFPQHFLKIGRLFVDRTVFGWVLGVFDHCTNQEVYQVCMTVIEAWPLRKDDAHNLECGSRHSK